MKYKATKIFTSRDGRLDPDDREYGIDQEGLDILGDDRPHLGGATQIFAKTEGGPSDTILFSSRDGQYNFPIDEKPESGWASFDLTHDNASYNPDRGEVGWWNVSVADAPSDVVEGIGLPYSWHVSTFIVFEWVDEDEDGGETGEGPEIPTDPDPEERNLLATILLFDDGTYEFQNELPE